MLGLLCQQVYLKPGGLICRVEIEIVFGRSAILFEIRLSRCDADIGIARSHIRFDVLGQVAAHLADSSLDSDTLEVIGANTHKALPRLVLARCGLIG